jgi:hypothetical protein
MQKKTDKNVRKIKKSSINGSIKNEKYKSWSKKKD